MNPQFLARALCAALLLGLAAQAVSAEEVVVIGHAGLPAADRATLMRLYTGRSIELAGTPVTVINTAPGTAIREYFLKHVVLMDETRYRAYWTVRRHVGKGAPPQEMDSDQEVIRFVTTAPGSVGYIGVGSVTEGLNVIGRY